MGLISRARVALGVLGWMATLLGMPLASSAADLDTIRDRGYLVVAVKANSPPLGFEGEGGQLQGFEVDLARRLAAALLGNEAAVELVPVTNTERIPLLLEDQVDMVIARLTVTERRSRLVNFSRPYYYDGTALITRRPELQGFADIGAGPVAVLEGASTIDALRWHLPGAELVGVDSYDAAFALLEAGDAVAFGGDASVLTGWQQEHLDYQMLPTLLSAEALAVAMPRGLQHQTLHQQVDEAIEDWHATGWLSDRIRSWGLPLDGLGETLGGIEETLDDNLNESGSLQ